MIAPTPTRITDRPLQRTRLPPPPEPVNDAFCWVFSIVCIVVIVVGSAWAIWENVR